MANNETPDSVGYDLLVGTPFYGANPVPSKRSYREIIESLNSLL